MRRILVFVFWFAIVSLANAHDLSCQQRHCIAVVDAGSSGSRLHIYALDEDENPTQINEIWSKKIKPGFAMIDSEQEKVSAYLDQLFADVPLQNMPVYFYATAGMRILSQPKQQLYYQALDQWFAVQPHWQLVDAKTITGAEEGVLGWLAVNYQLGRLTTTEQPYVSVMDMGGASVQVTFPIQHIKKINPRDLVEVDIFGRHLVLFVHSFLGLGQTLLSQQFLDAEACFSTGYQLPSGLNAKGDASSCQKKVSKLINQVHRVNHIVHPALENNCSNIWFAIGGVASIADDEPFSFEDKQFTNQSLLQQANSKVCQSEWHELYAKYNNQYLYGYCLFPSYYYALMVDGYGISPEQPIHFIPNGQGADWSLGVVLRQH